MKLALPLALAVSLATAVSSDAVARSTELETEPHTFKVSARHRVQVNFPVGQLQVLPGDDSQVRFEIRVRCRGGSEERCESMANRLVLDSKDRDGTLRLTLDDYPKWHNKGFQVMATMHVPRTMPVRVEMGVGQLSIEGLEGDLNVDLGVGEADIVTSRVRAQDVSVDTGIGDASIRGGGVDTRRHGFIGASASWDGGKGSAKVRLHVGVGDATVRLD